MAVTLGTKTFGRWEPLHVLHPSPYSLGAPVAAIRALPVVMTITLAHPMGKCHNKLWTAGYLGSSSGFYARLFSACSCFLLEHKGLVLPTDTFDYL